jgi:hypothetical protein
MRNLVGEEGWSGQARRLAGWLNPVVASPAAPLETFAALDAVGPSLMPRTSRLQGIAMGLGTLGARATAGAAERLTNMAVPAEAPMGRRLATRALIGAGGTALAMLPERDGDRLWLASVRTTGRLLRAGAAGGAVHDLGEALQGRYPAQRAVRPLAVSAALTSGLLFWGARRLKASEAAVARWPLPQTTTLPATLATSYAVTAVGTGLTRGFVWSRGRGSPISDPGRPSGCWPGWSMPACGRGRPRRSTAPGWRMWGGPTRRSSLAMRPRRPARWCRAASTACCRSATSASRDAATSPTWSPPS